MLNAELKALAGILPNGNMQELLDAAKAKLLVAGFTKIDYLACVDATTLEPLDKLQKPARLLAAAWLGNTRLIDNIAL